MPGIPGLLSAADVVVEMTAWDQQWQERITKVVRRVAQDLIANDESEISEVVRRRLFEDFGPDRTRQQVARAYADWCFERSARLPAEWTAVGSASTKSIRRLLCWSLSRVSADYARGSLVTTRRDDLPHSIER